MTHERNLFSLKFLNIQKEFNEIIFDTGVGFDSDVRKLKTSKISIFRGRCKLLSPLKADLPFAK